MELDARRAQINSTMTQGANGPAIQSHPKTKLGNRFVPLPPEVIQAIEWRVLRGQPDNGLLFIGPSGGIVSHGVASPVVAKAVRALGLVSGWHSSRHYFASHLLRTRVPLPAVSQVLGHGSPQMTASTYSWVLDDHEAEAQVLDVLLSA